MRQPIQSFPETDSIACNADAFAVFDRFPVTPGHVLVVTRRIVETWFEATAGEQAALMSLVNEVKSLLDERLFVPDKTACPGRPVGPTAVQLPDGSRWEFKFVKVACNVAAPEGEKSNQLSDLLRKWFGLNAGLPGTC